MGAVECARCGGPGVGSDGYCDECRETVALVQHDFAAMTRPRLHPFQEQILDYVRQQPRITIPVDMCRIDDGEPVTFAEAHALLDAGATDVECDHDICPRECPNWSPSYVTINEAGPFACTLYPDRWNGWACPGFTEEEARTMLAALQADDEDWIRWEFREAERAFAIFRHSDGDEGPEVWPIGEDGLYAIGAWAWVWEVADLETEIEAHNCNDFAQPIQTDGPLGHGWACSKCGAFLQAG